jgi:hypothetical protein
MAPANSRIACWPFVTEYKLHKGRPPHRHMPRMRAPISTRTPWLGPRTPAYPAAITGHAVLLKRFNSPSGMKRVLAAFA